MLELEQDVGTCQLKAVKMTPVDWCALFCIVSCMVYKLRATCTFYQLLCIKADLTYPAMAIVNEKDAGTFLYVAHQLLKSIHTILPFHTGCCYDHVQFYLHAYLHSPSEG